MADDIFKWIRSVSSLNDEQLKQEIDLVHQSSIKAFARALAKVRRNEVDTHTLRSGALTEHDFADTINLLLSIGEQTVTAINSNVPVSLFPYNVSTHMDVDSRIKVLTQKITEHKSEIPSGRETSSQATHLQLRQLNSIASRDSFHSIEDDEETDCNQSTQDDMILSGSIVNLNIK
jgi:hypothetical protein